jgi:hypothetical protein
LRAFDELKREEGENVDWHPESVYGAGFGAPVYVSVCLRLLSPLRAVLRWLTTSSRKIEVPGG